MQLVTVSRTYKVPPNKHAKYKIYKYMYYTPIYCTVAMTIHIVSKITIKTTNN